MRLFGYLGNLWKSFDPLNLWRKILSPALSKGKGDEMGMFLTPALSEGEGDEMGNVLRDI